MKLELIDLNKNYGIVHALKDFTSDFSLGIYGILGANGAGKSTLFNLLTDNIKIQEGCILWNGEDIRKLGKEYRKEMGYLAQQQGYYEKMSVVSYMKYVAWLKGLKRADYNKQMQELLERVNMWEHRFKRMGSLSGGMRQRVLLACTFLGNPRLLILDEPSAGLDPKERVELRKLIKEMSQDKIILLSTHIVSDIADVANQVLIMDEGRLLVRGTCEELMEKYKVNNLEEVYLEAVKSKPHQFQ